MKPTLTIMTGTQGSGNHLFSKALGQNKNIFVWPSLQEKYWEGHDLEPFAEYWKDPEKFDPFRFLGESGDKIHPFAHIPFGGGPRVCIGQNMAKMQVLLVMSAIVRAYDFELTDKKELGLHAMMLLKPDGPVNMKFHRIRN